MSLKEKITRRLACNSVGRPESVIGRTFCLLSHPGKIFLAPFAHWFRHHYQGHYRFERIVFVIDLLLIGIAIGLGSIALLLSFYKPLSFADQIAYDVSVAPREIISGAPSTLIIRYTNETNEELHNVTLTVKYPEHFLLQEVLSEEEIVDEGVISLGTIPVGGTGSIKITGVIFGDVGGEQTFQSKMTFVHGENKEIGYKTSEHTFSPSGSTLHLSLSLPEQLIAYQEVSGAITYENTGIIDFPTISVVPQWPDGFSLSSSNPLLENGRFSLPSIQAGEKGEMTFTGYLGEIENEVSFIFSPSFTFGNTHYAQETLKQTSPVLPPQLSINHTIDRDSLRPGSEVNITIHYENIGESSLTNVQIGFETESPFFTEKNYLVDQTTYPELTEILPGQSGDVIVKTKTRSSLMQSEAREEISTVKTQAIAIYVLGENTGQTILNKGTLISSLMTTPLVLESFARYSLPSGDQLGRGPLPPQVGAETKYWIFWHVTGTINPLSTIELSGILPENVRFTGRQTVSQNGGVSYDEVTRTITWTSDRLLPTLFADSTVVGIAFEVGITPTEDQIGSSPYLINDIQITGVDETTGLFVSAGGASATTNL